MTSFAVAADRWSELDEDQALVKAAQDQPEAFAAIYERYAQRIYLYVRTRVTSEEDAVDLTQQVFVKGLRALPGYRTGEAPLSAWLFRIARNAVIDHQRRCRSTCTLDSVPPLLREHGLGPEDTALRNEDVRRLREALLRLAPDKRELIALRYAGRLKMREIALATGKSEAATKKRLFRALKTLKENYDEIP